MAAVAEMAQSMAQSPSSAQEALMKRTFTELCDELASIAPAGMVHVTAYVRLTNIVHCSVFFIGIDRNAAYDIALRQHANDYLATLPLDRILVFVSLRC